MKSYFNWYKYNRENDIIEVTKDKFPEGDKYICEENGWQILEGSELKIDKEKE